MEPQTRTESSDALDPALIRKIKLALIALAVIGVGVLAFFIVREIQQEKVGARWDEFARIQDRHELSDMSQDPLYEGGADSTYFERRANFIQALVDFLPDAESEDDALGPQVHWLIAKLAADQVISMKDELDVAKRGELWGLAEHHMRVILDRYPDYQANWTMFAPPGQTSLTRAFLATIAANQNWEAKNLPRPQMPSADPVVVVRTERGDMRIGLYRESAKTITDLFLTRATRGDYDGTAFFAKTDRRRGGTPLDIALRGGHPATRDAKPFDRAGSAAFADTEYGDTMPAESRYLVPVERGVVVAWHDAATVYDGAQQFVIAQQRSPLLDYDYSPIGKLLDDASLETLDRIFAGDAWRDDTAAATPTDEDREVADFLQAPVKIVKVLVFENGALVQPEAPGPTKASIAPDESTLEGLTLDAYKVDAPERPAPPPEDPEDPETPGSEDDAPTETPEPEGDGN